MMETFGNVTFQFREEEARFFSPILSEWPKVNFTVEILKTKGVVLPISKSSALCVKAKP